MARRRHETSVDGLSLHTPWNFLERISEQGRHVSCFVPSGVLSARIETSRRAALMQTLAISCAFVGDDAGISSDRELE